MTDRFSEKRITPNDLGSPKGLGKREGSPSRLEQFREEAAQEREARRIQQEAERKLLHPKPVLLHQGLEERPEVEESSADETIGPFTQWLKGPKIRREMVEWMPLEIAAEIPPDLIDSRPPLRERFKRPTKEDIVGLGSVIRNLDDTKLNQLRTEIEKQGSPSDSLRQLDFLETFRGNPAMDTKEAGANLVHLIREQLLSRFNVKKTLSGFAENLREHILSTWPDITTIGSNDTVQDKALVNFCKHFYQLANPEPTSIKDVIPPDIIQQLGQTIRNLDKDFLEGLGDSLEIKNLGQGETVACMDELQAIKDFRLDAESNPELDPTQAVINLVRLVRYELKGRLDGEKKDFKANLEKNLPLEVTVDRLCSYQNRIDTYLRPAETTSTAPFHGVVFWSDRLGSEPTGRGLEDFPGQAAIHWEAAPTLAR